LRTILAVAVTGLIVAAFAATAQSAPLVPLAPGITTTSQMILRMCHGVAVGAIAADVCIAVAAGATGGAEFAAGEILRQKTRRVSALQ